MLIAAFKAMPPKRPASLKCTETDRGSLSMVSDRNWELLIWPCLMKLRFPWVTPLTRLLIDPVCIIYCRPWLHCSGTKHIDPNTGLIYFKYDFGYEFGILFPGEGKKIMAYSATSTNSSGQPIASPRTHDIEVPVIHERTRGGASNQNPLATDDPSKRYSLPIEIDLDHLHDPNYQTKTPGRGRL